MVLVALCSLAVCFFQLLGLTRQSSGLAYSKPLTLAVSHIYGIHFFEWRARRGSAAPRSVNHRKEFAGGSPVVTHQFQALRRFRDAVLFRSVRPSSIQWFLFWLLGLTVQSSRPAFGGRLTFGVRWYASALNCAATLLQSIYFKRFSANPYKT